uniref:F-box domain-containing protein n=1 Tax=Phaeomonas parva TaxID=124430 RepID=A0A7S1XVH4_9STRA|mmetsp:Transcript_37268/g.116531  ORF Transcript_37268/g.116531 Transcript_37268/m.116531 type:complete len:337 (+) Transcript_37268:414-1424(+)
MGPRKLLEDVVEVIDDDGMSDCSEATMDFELADVVMDLASDDGDALEDDEAAAPASLPCAAAVPRLGAGAAAPAAAPRFTAAMASSRDNVLCQGDAYALHLIVAHLSAAELMEASLACRFWRQACTSDYQWQHRCAALWANKVFVPSVFRERSMSRVQAYWGSIRDSKRSAIHEDELCSLVFYHRMKGWSGESWTTQDPWWSGQAPVQRRFHEDGTMTSDMGDGHWRVLDVPEACNRRGDRGAFLRLSRGGVEFPTIFVSRDARNWGWILQNCWAFSTSFPLPPRGADAELEDGGAICQQVQRTYVHKARRVPAKRMHIAPSILDRISNVPDATKI